MKQAVCELLKRYPALKECGDDISVAVESIIALYRNCGTLFICGNGGSASDAEHMAGELLKGFLKKRPLDAEEKQVFASIEDGEAVGGKLQKGLRAVSLLSHPAFLSAFNNDVDPYLCYAQQVYAMGRKGDILLGISTGGGAVNVKNSFIAAKAKKMNTILLTGNRHGVCEKLADIVIRVPESETFRIQELHLPIYHAICAAVEAEFFEE